MLPSLNFVLHAAKGAVPSERVIARSKAKIRFELDPLKGPKGFQAGNVVRAVA